MAMKFKPMGRGVYRATNRGHTYEIKGHPDRGYGVWRDGKHRYPGHRMDSLRAAKEAATDLAEFDEPGTIRADDKSERARLRAALKDV